MTGHRAWTWRLALVVALLFGAAGPAQAKRDFDSEVVRAARMLTSWRFEEASKLIAELSKRAPRAPESRYLRAQLAFVSGDYDTALDHIAGLDDDALGGSIGDIRKLVESTREATADFASKKSAKGNFIISYKPGKEEAIVDLAGDVLETARSELAKDFGYTPPGPVRVELLGAPSDLAKVSTLTVGEIETTGTIALCKYGKLMVVSPRATVFGYPWMDTLVHEYVHYVVSSVSHDRVPVWLHEGLARYQQGRWRGPAGTPLTALDEHLLAEALKKNDLIPFDDMHPSMAKLPSQKAAALAFAEVATMIAYVHSTKGYNGIRKALDQIQRGKSARKALADVMGTSWDKVERGWKQYLRAAKLRPQPALAGRAESRRIRFVKGNSSDENVGADEVASKKARKFARLGGMLRMRGMSEAASVEYEKALAATGGMDPFIAGKLSRTYLELGKYQKAIELARPLLASDEHDAVPPTTLGLAHLAQDEPGEAAKAFEIALRISPFDPAVRCGLAEAYSKTGNAVLAERETRACDQVRQ